MKRTLVVLTIIAILLNLTSFSLAYASTDDNIYSYELKEDGTVKIADFSYYKFIKNYDKSVDVQIPSILDGYVVTEIASLAFHNCECTGTVVIPDTVQTIGSLAFHGSDFSSMVISKSVNNVSEHPFGLMHNLSSFYVDAGNATFATIDGVLFEKASKTLVAYPLEKGGRYNIPEGIITIGSDAFDSNDNTLVFFPSTLRNIEDGAFSSYNRGISSEGITIPDGVETIGDSAFDGCHGLSMFDDDGRIAFVLPASVREIGNWAFAFCSPCYGEHYSYIDLSQISISVIPDRAFLHIDSSEVSTILLPNSLQCIEDSAFESVNVGEIGITFPDSLITIGDYAFQSGEGRISFSESGALKHIGNKAFSSFAFRNAELDLDTLGNSYFTLELPDGLESIGDKAFENVSGIDRIVIPSSVTYIGTDICSRDIILDVEQGTYGETYAIENGYMTETSDTSWLDTP